MVDMLEVPWPLPNGMLFILRNSLNLVYILLAFSRRVGCADDCLLRCFRPKYRHGLSALGGSGLTGLQL